MLTSRMMLNMTYIETNMSALLWLCLLIFPTTPRCAEAIS